MATQRTTTTARTPRANALGAANPRDDDRLHKQQDADGRGSRSREDAERASDEGTSMSVEQRRAAIRSEFLQEALPRVPDVPGFHLCWLSTTNGYDPVHKRMRLGYMPVRAEELEGFESLKMASGEFAGAISCNEMVLFKIPLELYEMIMQEFHHNMPLEEEEALRQQLVRDTDVDSKGKKLGQITEDSDGFDDLGARRARQGVFAH